MPTAAVWGNPPLLPRLAAARRIPLVGRNRELESLEAVWEEVRSGHRQVVFVGGEPGAGKTRLIAEVAGALHDDGVTVLVGASSPDAGIPYEPFTEMLNHLFDSAPPGSLSGVLDRGGAELVRIAASIARHRPDVAGEGDTIEVRRDLFDAVAALVAELAKERPVGVFLDDLQWAQPPTLALLEHLLHASTATRLLVMTTFRTTAPDRSEELSARIAELHRLEGVRRLDLDPLDTEAIAQYVSARSGLSVREALPQAVLLRARTGGNPFYLRELWADLERQGGVRALGSSRRVPASIGDALAARLARLDDDVRAVIELGAVLGDTFDVATLVAAGEADVDRTIASVDLASDVGLIEALQPGASRYSFVHALTRQAVTDRMPHSRRALLHARAAGALESQGLDPAVVPRLANHYLAAHFLGLQDRALHYCEKAGELAERSLAFEDAAAWFEKGASLPICEPARRARMLLAAAANYVRSCDFPQARALYERLAGDPDPFVRLAAAMGMEDATWRPGLVGARAADMLSSAIDGCTLGEDDSLYARAMGSFGRALALAGQMEEAREVGRRAIEVASRLGDEHAIVHALATSLWHGTTPDMAATQHARASEVQRMASDRRDYELLGAAANFGATVSYLLGLPDELEQSVNDSNRAARGTAQPYYEHVYHCLAHAGAFMRGDFEEAQRWTDKTVEATFGDDMSEGPHGVQTFMIHRETGGLEAFRPYFDGQESFAGRWVPGLLALYTELGVDNGVRRALRHLMGRDLRTHTNEAQWPMEMVFMVEAALVLGDRDAARDLRPLVAEYEGMNLVCGTLIATFGSADRFLARITALLGDPVRAEAYFASALAMDQRMRSAVHVAETLAHHALSRAAAGRLDDAEELARRARELAEPIGQVRVLRLLEVPGQSRGSDGLTEREVAVLRLLAAGLSNQQIGAELHISGNTAANHVRSILMKTGASNRTQAAMYAASRNII